MNGIDKKFAELKGKGEKALIAYFTAGFPSAGETVEIVKKAEKCGADIIELGVPFSDPIADGPIIQYASFKSLERGMNTDGVFEICGTLKKSVTVPYLLMTYYNPVYRYGHANFSKKCAETGVSGVIIPDLPYEESAEIKKALNKYGVKLINFITPFTQPGRAEKILRDAEGFVYFVTLAGVTGPRSVFSDKTGGALKKVKSLTRVPVAAGFGISTPSQIEQIRDNIDGVIVGSFFVKKIIDGKMEELWSEIKRLKKPLAGREDSSG